MKAIIFNIQRFCIHDGPGIRTVIFFKGCNLKCWWCHNPESKKFPAQILFYPDKCLGCRSCLKVCHNKALTFDPHAQKVRYNSEKCKSCFACAEVCPAEAITRCGKEMTVEEVFAEAIKDKAFYETSGGGVTVSGGEPLMRGDFVAALFSKLKDASILTAVETAGAVKWAFFKKVVPSTDLFLFDLKSGDEEKLKSATEANLGQIIENLKRLLEIGRPVTVRIPIVPGFNSNQRELKKISELLHALPGIFSVTVLKYHFLAAGKHRALQEILPDSHIKTEKIEKIFSAGQEFFRQAGFTVV